MNLSQPNLTDEDNHANLYGEQRETAAPFCPGPGHMLGTDEDGWPARVEDCPTCSGGPVRNHTTFRTAS